MFSCCVELCLRCAVTLCYAVLCYVALFGLCYVTLKHVMLLCYVKARDVTVLR